MTLVTLYYYYPEKLAGAEAWVKELAEVLVACEQFEAYSNRQRGSDYYARKGESLEEAFNYLQKLRLEGILSQPVLDALTLLAAEGIFDHILAQARRAPLTRRELNFLRNLVATECAACR